MSFLGRGQGAAVILVRWLLILWALAQVTGATANSLVWALQMKRQVFWAAEHDLHAPLFCASA